MMFTKIIYIIQYFQLNDLQLFYVYCFHILTEFVI